MEKDSGTRAGRPPRLSRRAALRAGTAAGSAAMLGAAATAADGQSPPAAPAPGYTNQPIGGPVRLPVNPAAVRNASLLGLLDADTGRTPGTPQQEAELRRRIERVMRKGFLRPGGGPSELAVAVISRAVERYTVYQLTRGTRASALEPVRLRFEIRTYVDPGDQRDEPEDILSIELRSDIPMPPGSKEEAPISTLLIYFT